MQQLKRPSKIRSIAKIYPPQVVKIKQEAYVYSPLDHWVESHTPQALQNLIEIEGNKKPLFLNDIGDELILQNDDEVWMKAEQDWGAIRPKLKSQKHISSKTIKIEDSLINIDDEGAINLWNLSGGTDQQIEEEVNPESNTSIQSKDQEEGNMPSYRRIQTTLNRHSFVKQSRNGYILAPLVLIDQNLLTLHSNLLDEDYGRKRIAVTDLSTRECFTSFYSGSLPHQIRNISRIGNHLCAYGGCYAYLLDRRSRQIVLNLNDLDQSQVYRVTTDQGKDHQYTMCRDNSYLLMDWRRPGVVENIFNAYYHLDKCEIVNEDNSKFLFANYVHDSKVEIFRL